MKKGNQKKFLFFLLNETLFFFRRQDWLHFTRAEPGGSEWPGRFVVRETSPDEDKPGPHRGLQQVQRGQDLHLGRWSNDCLSLIIALFAILSFY